MWAHRAGEDLHAGVPVAPPTGPLHAPRRTPRSPARLRVDTCPGPMPGWDPCPAHAWQEGRGQVPGRSGELGRGGHAPPGGEAVFQVCIPRLLVCHLSQLLFVSEPLCLCFSPQF